MYKKEYIYTQDVLESIKKLADFLPSKIFDAHAHPINTAFLPSIKAKADCVLLDTDQYRKDMMPILNNPSVLRMNLITMPDKMMRDLNNAII